VVAIGALAHVGRGGSTVNTTEFLQASIVSPTLVLGYADLDPSGRTPSRQNRSGIRGHLVQL